MTIEQYEMNSILRFFPYCTAAKMRNITTCDGNESSRMIKSIEFQNRANLNISFSFSLFYEKGAQFNKEGNAKGRNLNDKKINCN